MVPVAGQLPIYFAAWYTGEPDRTPTWYIVQGYLSGNQVVAPIHRFTRRPGPAFAVDRSQVGNANVVLIDPERLAFAYTFSNADGTDRPRVAELMTHIAPGAPASARHCGLRPARSDATTATSLSAPMNRPSR